MQIRTRESIIEILCPAKLNLYLEVKAKRSDGYHEIESVMQTVSIYDRLLVEPADSGTQLSCSDPAIPSGDSNTVCRAVAEMRRATGIKECPRGRVLPGAAATRPGRSQG